MPKKEKKYKDIPRFKNENEEREFWTANDSTDYIDWSKSEKAAFPELKPSTQSISLRLPLSLLEDIKTLANSMDVPYQSLIKVMLAKSVQEKYKGR